MCWRTYVSEVCALYLVSVCAVCSEMFPWETVPSGVYFRFRGITGRWYLLAAISCLKLVFWTIFAPGIHHYLKKTSNELIWVYLAFKIVLFGENMYVYTIYSKWDRWHESLCSTRDKWHTLISDIGAQTRLVRASPTDILAPHPASTKPLIGCSPIAVALPTFNVRAE